MPRWLGAFVPLLLLLPSAVALEIGGPLPVVGSYVDLRDPEHSDRRVVQSFVAAEVAARKAPNLSAHVAGDVIGSISWSNTSGYLTNPKDPSEKRLIYSGREKIALLRASDHAEIAFEQRSYRYQSGEGLRYHFVTVGVWDEPCAMWQYPLREGATWTSVCQGTERRSDTANPQQMDFRGTFNVTGARVVNTSLGDFEALVVSEVQGLSSLRLEHLLAVETCGPVRRVEPSGDDNKTLTARYVRCAASGIDNWADGQPNIVSIFVPDEHETSGQERHDDLVPLTGGALRWGLLALLAAAILVGVALAMRRRKEKDPPAAP